MTHPPILPLSNPNNKIINVCEKIGELSLKLANPDSVQFFCVTIDSCEFDYASLNQCLRQSIAYYVFSRLKMESYDKNNDLSASGIDAIEFLRDSTNSKDKGAGAELGEILLYLFLEGVLNAPKLLSKVELKTSSNMYINGWDGVHLLFNPAVSSYQLIYGESKIRISLTDSINDAFDSISNFKISGTSDISLINSQILNETIKKEDAEFIRSLIIPSQNISQQFPIDKAFGIFLGYSFELKDRNKMKNIDCRNEIKKKIQSDIESILPSLQEKIKKYKLENHSFYVYILPFNDAQMDRSDIINKLMVRK